jgi:hypothetical protein
MTTLVIYSCDPEPAQQPGPNLHQVSLPHQSALCLLFPRPFTCVDDGWGPDYRPRLGSRLTTHLLLHSVFVRPGVFGNNCDPIVAEYLYSTSQICVFFHSPFTPRLSDGGAHTRRPFVRPGTSVATATKSSPTFVTASVSFVSSYTVQWVYRLRCALSIAGYKDVSHL